MTDKDKLKALLEELGIGFDDAGEDIVCEQGMEKVVGYSSFYTLFEFDKEGKFVQMGAWE